jgi:hypothetical protein
MEIFHHHMARRLLTPASAREMPGLKWIRRQGSAGGIGKAIGKTAASKPGDSCALVSSSPQAW